METESEQTRTGSPERRIAWTALCAGADVTSADGKHVGSVEHVLGDERVDIFDGVVIRLGHGPGGLRFVDAPQVALIFERHIVLTITSAEVHDLHTPSRNPASLEQHAADPMPTELHRKLARAWELMSGGR